MKKRALLIGIILTVLLLAACAARQDENVSAPTGEAPAQTIGAAPESVNETPAPELTIAPAPEATAEPTPDPTGPATAVIGTVGDIMVVPKHITAAQTLAGAEDAYDFSFCFPAVTNMFQSLDLMCGNLEGTLPGPDVDRYSSRQVDGYGCMRFGAPDSFAQTLLDAGFDCITTANNHACDYSVDGIISTIDVLDRYGIYHAGTYKSEQQREESPCVIDVNGIKIGIVAMTTVFNMSGGITDEQRNEMLARMQFFDLVQADINACRAAGAEFIIAFPHWGTEYSSEVSGGTRIYAQRLLEAGADAVIGSHPHIVQPFSYETVTRADGSTYTGLVAYSLGDFLTNMDFSYSCGLYVQLTVTRDEAGVVSLDSAAYMPVYCHTRYFDEVPFHQMLAALENPVADNAYGGPLDEREIKLLKSAREFVINICGTNVVPVMEDACWIS